MFFNKDILNIVIAESWKVYRFNRLTPHDPSCRDILSSITPTLVSLYEVHQVKDIWTIGETEGVTRVDIFKNPFCIPTTLRVLFEPSTKVPSSELGP